jgi:hypothetical protein
MKSKTIPPQEIDASVWGPTSIRGESDLAYYEIRKDANIAAAPDERIVFVSKHFAERAESPDVPSEFVLKRMLRMAIKIIGSQHKDAFNSYFVVTESPVELTNPADEKVQGYVGMPLIWTSRKRPGRNWKIVERVLKRCGQPTDYTKPTLGIATIYMSKALTDGEPVKARPEDVHVPVKAATVVLNDKPGTLTEGQQLALAHVLAAHLERNLRAMQTPFEAVASGFYGYIDHHSFSGSSDGNTLNIPQFYCNGLIFV